MIYLINRLGRTTRISICHISFSFFALLILAVLVLSSESSSDISFWRREIIGSAFIFICLVGMLASIRPRYFRRKLHVQMLSIGNTQRGHHPQCNNFLSHIVRFGNKILCAGCTGLFIGAFLSLIGSFIYFFSYALIGDIAKILFLLGFVGVLFGTIFYKIVAKNGIVRLFLNVFFVLGSFMLLVGIEDITGSIMIESYFLMFPYR